MKRKTTFPLLAACLFSVSLANAQINTPSLTTSNAPLLALTTQPAAKTTSPEEAPADIQQPKAGYKNFAFGIYAGLNSTKLRGETTGGDISGRLGYQAGVFVRGGGRIYGQLGAEYFASSSNYFTRGDGSTPSQIQDQINISYIQVPVYVGYKLLESDRGISAIRLQVGAEYANRISTSSGDFDLSNSEIKSGTFNALGQLGFDIGPVLIDLTYHHGLSDAIEGTGFNGSSRRILSASVGFKF
ncbi:outer membrane beta-barrel protein [Larkinella insperata]|uniref:Outer membrane beta-barrel protein n=1 Tax=Larkinella insperata TaxID=332158 RepID=A0ABW3QBJ2_9BACT